MTGRTRTLLRCALPVMLGALMSHPARAADATTSVWQPSVATYEVEYRGIQAGTITFALRSTGPGSFVYESRSNARGIARLVIRNEVLEASTFTVNGTDVVPQSYVLDDGSSDTSKDTRLEFDWSTGMARGQHENQPLEIALTPGLQDRMSVQTVVMQKLARGETLDRIAFIDRNEVKEYQYTSEGNATLQTAIGDVPAVIYSSTRPGSSRVSRVWYAPTLGYLPVRAEQIRRGKVETILKLTRLDRPD